MASELVETTRLFARTLANLEPEWIEKVGAHLIKNHESDPHWEKKAGNVIAFREGHTVRTARLYRKRKVDFSRKDPKNLSRDLYSPSFGRRRTRKSGPVLAAQRRHDQQHPRDGTQVSPSGCVGGRSA